jgi:replicative DNA helicase
MTSDHKMFLGQLLQQNSILYSSVIREEDFITDFDVKVFSAIKTVFSRGQIADLASVAAFDRSINVSKLASLTTGVTPVTWKQTQQRIIETSKRTELLKISEIIKSEPDNSTAIAAVRTELNRINDRSECEIVKADTLIQETVDLIEKRYKLNGQLPGIRSGIDKLDDTILGFEKRRLYVFGARPSQGKTALLCNFIHNCSVKAGIITAESSSSEIMKRLISIGGNLKLTSISTGFLRDSEFSKIFDVGSNYAERELYFFDEPNVSIDSCLLKGREMKRRFGIEILFIDYLQCLSGSPKVPRHEQVADISRSLKALARSLEIPVVVSAQLRRDAEGKRPQLSDFSDSTQIERDADVAVMIYQGEKKGESKKTYLLIAKNRDGPCRDIEVNFTAAQMRFENVRGVR